MAHSHARATNLDYMWSKRQNCVSCDGVSPVCNCAENERCILTGRSCTQCAQIECIPNSGGGGGKSVNPGVIAGPVVAALVILGLAALWWLRRKRRRDLARVEELAQRARKAEAAGFHLSSQPGSPGPGSARSARSERSSQRYGGNTNRHTSRSALAGPRSPDPNAPVNPEYYDENGMERAGRNDPFHDGGSAVSATSDRSLNVIPIRYNGPEGQERANGQGESGQRQGQKPRPGSYAARRLDEARNNLFKGNGAPARPARSPDLNLRLNPAPGSGSGLGPPSSYQDLRSPTTSGNYRDSYLSGHSGAPSYLSGSTDLHLEAPKIVTSRQVQVGRYQQAEMVQFGKPQPISMENMTGANHHGIVSSPAEMTANPFQGSQEGSQSSHDHEHDEYDHLQPPMPMSPATFGSRTLGSEVSGAAAGNASYRTLTPVSHRGEEEGLQVDDGMDRTTTSDGMRISMGSSMGYNDNRDSISTMGTGRYLAGAGGLPPPRYNNSNLNNHYDPRESMASGRSGTDSVLSAFPMIPPGQTRSRSGSNATMGTMGIGGNHSPIPQSTSVSTLEHAAMPSRPPTSCKPAAVPAPSPATAVNRNTQASLGLGSFPFVSPSKADSSAELPTGTSDGPPTIPALGRGRNTMGMSTTSEGLGEFDFSFDRDEPR